METVLATVDDIAAQAPNLADDVLTPREREVGLCLMRGMTNAQIGEALAISKATVGVHLHHMFQKTGLHRRRELAAYVGRIVLG